MHPTIYALHAADLTPALKMAALALLDAAHPDTGSVTLSRAQAQAAMSAGTWGTAKNRLSALKRAGLITYMAGDVVAVQISAATPAGASSHPQRLQSSPPEVTIVTATGDSDTGDLAESPPEVTIVTATGDNRHLFPPTPPRVSEYTDPIQDTEDSLTPAPAKTEKPEPAPLTDDQARTAAMLASLGLIQAEDLARRYGFEHCRNHALIWLVERETEPQNNAGLLAYRITHRRQPLAPKVAPHAVQEFKKAWPTDEERAEAARWAEIMAPRWTEDDPAPPPDDPAPETGQAKPGSEDAPRLVEDDPIWSQALAELAQQMTTATFETWMRGTALRSLEDGRAVIVAPNDYARSWLDDRLRATIKRTLGGIVQRSVAVEFVVG